MESLLDSFDGMASVSVSRNVFKDGLNSHFHSSAAVHEHIINMLFETIIRPCLNSDTDALGFTLL